MIRSFLDYGGVPIYIVTKRKEALTDHSYSVTTLYMYPFNSRNIIRQIVGIVSNYDQP